MKLYIGADHRGFTLKDQLKKYLKDHEVIDVGAEKFDPTDDYPDFAKKVAEQVASNPHSRGILLCGSGMGVDIVANKIKGARAGLALNEKQIKEATSADNINILAIAADYTEPEDAKEMIDVFLSTQYQPQDRRERRLQKIEKIEKS